MNKKEQVPVSKKEKKKENNRKNTWPDLKNSIPTQFSLRIFTVSVMQVRYKQHRELRTNTGSIILNIIIHKQRFFTLGWFLPKRS